MNTLMTSRSRTRRASADLVRSARHDGLRRHRRHADAAAHRGPGHGRARRRRAGRASARTRGRRPAAETGRPETAMSRPAGPDTASAPTIGLTATIVAVGLGQRLRSPGTARIGPMEVMGLDGHTITPRAARWPRARPAPARASAAPTYRHLADLDLRLLAHEVLLEVEPAVGPEQARPHGLVRHRQEARGHAEAARRWIAVASLRLRPRSRADVSGAGGSPGRDRRG